MYLSNLAFNPRSRRTQTELGNRYELHRTLLSAFGPRLPENERLLYRLEIGALAPRLLLQSHTRPQWDALSQKQFLLTAPEIKSFIPQFEPGQRYIFRLLANPTARRKFEDQKTGKRVGLYHDEEQRDWLARKATHNGFIVLDAAVRDQGFIQSVKQENGTRHAIRHLAIQFDGLLRVNDPQKFLYAVQNGIGSAKGFGFGLLSLARA